jgi:flagellar hook-associated protein 1 FlgK
MDTRDALSLRLAELTGAKATELNDGTMLVTLNGSDLVNGFDAATLTTVAGPPTTFELDPDVSGGNTAVAGNISGDLGATVELLDNDLPAYLADLAVVAQDLADSVNTAHANGYDASGTAGAPLFTYGADVLDSLTVAITDPKELALSALPGGGKDGNNASALADAVNVDDSYQKLVNGFGSKVASAKQLADNQMALTTQVDNAREQLAGVSLDEETVNMLSAQRAYESAARVMTTLDDVLDTLINRMAR